MLSLDTLKSYLASDPGNAELACELADRLFSVADFQAAQATLDGLPGAVRNSPAIRFRLSRLDLIFGRYEQAEQHLVGLLEAGQDSSAIGHDLAFALLCQRRLEAATAVIDETIHRHGPTPELHVLQARLALMARDYAGAQHALDSALLLQPDDATALGLRALGRLDAGDSVGAREAAALCLARHPNQHEALLTAGALALWQGEMGPAEQYFSQALARFPNSGRALSGLGQVMLLDGRLDGARATLERAVAAMVDHIGTWHALGWAQLLQGDLPAAERSYRSAYELDRNFAESHGGLAVVALLQERSAEGEAAMKRALKLDPRCMSGRYARTLWLEAQGEQSQSTVLFAELLGEGALPGVSGGDAALMAARLKARALSGSQTQ
jgi:Flp pilus assembly protein TadD